MSRSDKPGVNSDPSVDININRQKYKDTLDDPSYSMNGDFNGNTMHDALYRMGRDDLDIERIQFPAAPREPLTKIPGGILGQSPFEPGPDWWEKHAPEPGPTGRLVRDLLKDVGRFNKEENIKKAGELGHNVEETEKTLKGISEDKDNKKSTLAEKLEVLKEDKANLEGSLKAKDALITGPAEELKDEIIKKYGDRAYSSDPRNNQMDYRPDREYYPPIPNPQMQKELDAVDARTKSELETSHKTPEYIKAKETLKKAEDKQNELEGQEKENRRDRVQNPQAHAQGAANGQAPAAPNVASNSAAPSSPSGVKPEATHNAPEQPIGNAPVANTPKVTANDLTSNLLTPNAKENTGMDIKLDNKLAESLKGSMTMSDSYVADLAKPKGGGIALT